jgi:glucose/arabinose dehydrogenase
MKLSVIIMNYNGKLNLGKRLVLLIGILTFFIIQMSCKKSNTQSSTGSSNFNLQLVANNLAAPLTLAEAPDNSKRLFIVDQVGKVWIIYPDSSKAPTIFIDVSSKMVSLQPGYDERGLLGLAFHPNYKANGKFYLFYTAPPRAGGPQPGAAWNNLTRISEFTVSSADPNLADINSEKIILEADHPQLNHNGGTILFGNDGYLYISIGDGGGADDDGPGHVSDWYSGNAGGNGQDIYHNLMGNILRIDVNNGNPYSIPADNPFVGTAALPEIYAYGLRNPYRFSIDMGGSHQLLVGDAGQSLYEEIDLVIKGGNYGWNVKEGKICFNTDNDLIPRNGCPAVDSAGKPLIDPVIQLPNHSNPVGGVATVIIGGNVYRGTSLSSLQGKYIFGIFSQDGGANAKVYSATPSSSADWAYETVSFKDFPDNLGQFLKGFGQDLSGEIYVMTSTQQGLSGNTGKVYKLVGVP